MKKTQQQKQHKTNKQTKQENKKPKYRFPYFGFSLSVVVISCLCAQGV